MLFGCLPIVNIPVFIAGIGVLVFGIGMLWSEHCDEMRERELQRIRCVEHRRKTMQLVEQGRKSRAERIGRYHGLV